MNADNEQFFRMLGECVANARRAHGMTQQQLAFRIGIAQQTLAHYEVGRSRIPASMLPELAGLLTLSFDGLMGKPVVRLGGKRIPMSRLQQQVAAIEQLPKTKQQFVSQGQDTVLAEARQ
ncbi:helix-turn-helix domain-containing protein [Paraburkholderia silviterrae]|uniref:XRE family transcriptional regulator n=1 Tax=Paraburkholderia silviterrae TaxID=2528715 RepID=A0A4R5MBM0_9BURK|nr:helix-turn-helix transcriptional regulator [Paraburkholderia silviterrae]TDG24180.1 XRE family transcriptional regulator [Paraburkholderia silviterrae]